MRFTNKLTAAALAVTILISGCASDNAHNTADKETAADSALSSGSAEICGQMELEYAEQFSVSYRTDGCSEITSGTERFLFVPEGVSIPENNTLPVIHEAHEKIYLAASSAMDLFYAAGAEGCLEFTSTSAENWSSEKVKNAVKNDDIFYVGKYSAPDYEFLISEGCSLAIESTMITHTPQVKSMLEELGITVFTERSSYEAHPLGRLEWIKLYGLITGREEEAEAFFEEKMKLFSEISADDIPENEKKTVAFFYITSAGYINVRKPGDYVTKIIELAGGKYAFTNDDLGTDEGEMSTVNMQMEEFYIKAKDADIIIYNSTIEGEITGTEQLLGKSPLFSDFKAFREGHVYCTGQNMFQQTSECADMIKEFSCILTDSETDNLKYLTRLD